MRGWWGKDTDVTRKEEIRAPFYRRSGNSAAAAGGDSGGVEGVSHGVTGI